MSLAESRLENAKGAYPFDSAVIVEAEYQVEDISQVLERLQRYEAELFGTDNVAKSSSDTTAPAIPVKKSKATTEQGKARAKAAGFIVDEEEKSEV